MLAPASNALVAAGTLTIEMWVYPTAFGSVRHIVGSKPSVGAGPVGLHITAAGIVQYTTNSAIPRLSSTAAIPLNTWTHIAVSSSASIAALYINGVQQQTPANFGNTFVGTGLFIGSNGDGSEPFQGYIDDLRITKGISRYPAAFNPVKAPFAPKSIGMETAFDPYAGYVIAQLRMEGTNGGTTFVEDTGKTVTRVGTPTTSTAQTKYGSSSAVFNGTTDYLSLPAAASNAYGTGDFTMECWCYQTARASIAMLFSQGSNAGNTGIACYINASGTIVVGSHTAQYINSTSTLPLNTWNHVAVVRVGTVLSLYLNGLLVGTAPNSINFTDQQLYVGQSGELIYYFTGYIDDVRMTKGVARYLGPFVPPTAQLPLLTASEYLARYPSDTFAAQTVLHMGFDGVKPYDSTQPIGTPVITGTVAPNTLQFIEGGAGTFNGASYVTMPTNSKYAIGTGAFTLESWVYMTARAALGVIVTTNAPSATDNGPLLVIKADGTLSYQTWNGAIVASSAALPLNQWNHVAISRSGTTTKLFINGSLVATALNDTRNYTDAYATVGAMSGGGSPFTGILDNVRITKAARYTADFVPIPGL